uniref:Fcf2 domain-containing protein n=1 Tax=Rhabditophanes sp. KR3021 TaxID=114890 RepID=A0AC35UDN8_9BILA
MVAIGNLPKLGSSSLPFSMASINKALNISQNNNKKGVTGIEFSKVPLTDAKLSEYLYGKTETASHLPKVQDYEIKKLELAHFKKSKSKKSKPSTPFLLPIHSSKPADPELVATLQSHWNAFSTAESGEQDTTIVHYTPKPAQIDPTFIPFNLDTFLTEKIIRELDLDPKVFAAST